MRVDVFLYITVCLQVLIVRAVKGSFTQSLNDDSMHAHVHKQAQAYR